MRIGSSKISMEYRPASGDSLLQTVDPIFAQVISPQDIRLKTDRLKESQPRVAL
jgi:hypothetical protein